MLIIQDILVSDDLVREHFLCQLDQCKGACCYEGDFGAPLEKEELDIIQSIFSVIKPYLGKDQLDFIEKWGIFAYYSEPQFTGAQLMPNGACIFMGITDEGISQCAFELAYRDGLTPFKKPISCHLYPVRVKKEEEISFEALNYDRWEICSAACKAGKEIKLPVYRFVKEAIIRKYGEDFYHELDAAAEHLKSK